MPLPPVPGRAARWLESGLLDLEFYSALRGREFENETQAARDFVERGMPERLSPHPFLDFVSLPSGTRRAWRAGRVNQVLADLADAGAPRQPPDPVAARTDLLDLAVRLGRESPSDVARVPERPAARPRQDGRMSVVIVAGEARPTIRTVTGVLEEAEGFDVEVLLVDPGAPAHVALALCSALRQYAEVHTVRLPKTSSWMDAVNLGLGGATGDLAVLLHPRVVLRRGALPQMLVALGDPGVAGVQPLLLAEDDTIWSAGLMVVAEGCAPARVLVGHPAEDARRVAGYRLGAICAGAMALRTEDVVAVGGLAPDLEPAAAALDLCARLLRHRPAGFRVAPAARATVVGGAEVADPVPAGAGIPADPRLLERVGFVVEASSSRHGADQRQQVVVGRRLDGPGQLRWSIKLPSPPGRQGDLWGDTHFAEALADGLVRLGDDVVTSRRGAHAAGPTFLDDVTLGLRGLYPVTPLPGQVNVLWIISHPDEVDTAELQGFDLVLAASVPWSAELSHRSGRHVVPLLQATSFQPPAGPVDPADTVVFVGTAGNDRKRPLVEQAVEAGVPLAVYGPGWEGRLPEGVWRGDYVSNDRLPELYARHGIVLADHWPDMARHGFIANRVFDAVAAGARVISDDVAGMHDVFDTRDVVVVRSAAEVGRAVQELRSTAPAPAVPRPSLTFADRARTLRQLVDRL